MAYIDTSVLVAYYCPERLSRAAEKAIRKTDPPVISPLVEVEMFSAVAAKTRVGGIAAQDAGRILSCFRGHYADGVFTIVSIGAREYATACEWLGSFSTALRTVDALHLAAASANGLTILTADRNLARAARRLRVGCTLIA